MPDFGIYAGDTNKTIYVRLRDSTTGLGKTGLVFNSAGATCSYTLPLAARAAITLATQTVTGAHTDGGFVEVDATNCKGLYRLDLSDAAIASGDFTIISIEFDGIIEESILIPLHTRNVNVTQWLGTAAATPTVAGVPEVDITHIGGSSQSATDLKDFADAGYDPGTNTVSNVASLGTGAITSGTFASNSITNDAIAVGGLPKPFSTGTAQAGAANTVTLAAGETATDDLYQGSYVKISAGTGSGQSRIINTYNGTTKVATVNPNWITNPASDSTYEIWEADARIGMIQAVEATLSAAGTMETDCTSVSGDAAAANNMEAFFDGTGYASGNSTIGTCTTNTDMRGTDNAALASVCTEVRLAELDAANLPTDVANVQTDTTAIVADTNELQTDWSDGGRLDLILDNADRTVQMTEGYALDGVAPTFEEMQFMIWSALSEFAISSTTITSKKLDGTTTAMTFTLDDATNPTSRTRAT